MTTLPSARELRERVDTAQVLTRFHYLERALTLAGGAWIPSVPRLEQKAALARAAWQCSLAADGLRERVFELRYPSRLLEAGSDAPLIRVYAAAVEAPDADSFLRGLSEVLLPALLAEYRDFLAASDELDDGPTARILEAAARDKEEQIASLGHGLGTVSKPWPDELRRGLDTLEPPSGTPFCLAEDPSRDDRYFASSVYWPDVVDPNYPYGEGLALQVRSAVSHLNEVWAVETAGAILYALAEPLGWEFVRDAARWTYDESRHMLMGKRRLEAWGIEPGLVPLGGYIYEACRGKDPIYRLGMLGYFETKNIGRKRDRAAAFREMGDRMSETDMEFDWADETLHAEYGRHWLKRLLETRGEDPESWPQVLERCEELVHERIAATMPAEQARIGACADRLLARAEALTREPDMPS
jgi:uncharacterized ferritin-like protein (DUF455 family)